MSRHNAMEQRAGIEAKRPCEKLSHLCRLIDGARVDREAVGSCRRRKQPTGPIEDVTGPRRKHFHECMLAPRGSLRRNVSEALNGNQPKGDDGPKCNQG